MCVMLGGDLGVAGKEGTGGTAVKEKGEQNTTPGAHS